VEVGGAQECCGRERWNGKRGNVGYDLLGQAVDTLPDFTGPPVAKVPLYATGSVQSFIVNPVTAAEGCKSRKPGRKCDVEGVTVNLGRASSWRRDG
jgi:hypothetical protein